MHVFAQAFWIPKKGNTPDEYEDAFWPESQLDQSDKILRFAVADGATETSFSGYWARLLTEGYCTEKIKESGFVKSLQPLQNQWLEYVNDRELQWYAEEKLQYGAASSIIGITLINEGSPEVEGGSWEALAVGDSCFFQIRNQNLIASFPLTHSEQFNSRPWLISSNPRFNSKYKQNIKVKKGTWKAGDVFILMTDAIAHWYLLSVENECNPHEALLDLTENNFSQWIIQLRENNDLRNDDVTLYRIETT